MSKQVAVTISAIGSIAGLVLGVAIGRLTHKEEGVLDLWTPICAAVGSIAGYKLVMGLCRPALSSGSTPRPTKPSTPVHHDASTAPSFQPRYPNKGDDSLTTAATEREPTCQTANEREINQLVHRYIDSIYDNASPATWITQFKSHGEATLPFIENAIEANWNSRLSVCEYLLYPVSWIGGSKAEAILAAFREYRLSNGTLLSTHCVFAEYSEFSGTATSLLRDMQHSAGGNSIDEKRVTVLRDALKKTPVESIEAQYAPTAQDIVTLATHLTSGDWQKVGVKGFDTFLSLIERHTDPEVARSIPRIVEVELPLSPYGKTLNYEIAGQRLASKLLAHGKPSQIVDELLTMVDSPYDSPKIPWPQRVTALVLLAELGEKRAVPYIQEWLDSSPPGSGLLLCDWVKGALNRAITKLL